jgi:hypothetical protein
MGLLSGVCEMAQDTDVLWGLYQEHCDQGRHHENQRAAVTNVIIAIAAGVLGIASLDQSLDKTDIPMTLFIVILGLFGALLCAKHYERFEMHAERYRKYRDELEQLLPSTKIRQLKEEADKKHNRRYPRLHKVRLFWLWVGIHLGIAVFGLALSLLALLSPIVKACN